MCVSFASETQRPSGPDITNDVTRKWVYSIFSGSSHYVILSSVRPVSKNYTLTHWTWQSPSWTFKRLYRWYCKAAHTHHQSMSQHSYFS